MFDHVCDGPRTRYVCMKHTTTEKARHMEGLHNCCGWCWETGVVLEPRAKAHHLLGKVIKYERSTHLSIRLWGIPTSFSAHSLLELVLKFFSVQTISDKWSLRSKSQTGLVHSKHLTSSLLAQMKQVTTASTHRTLSSAPSSLTPATLLSSSYTPMTSSLVFF